MKYEPFIELPQSLLDIRYIREAHFKDMVINDPKSEVFKRAEDQWNDLWDQTFEYFKFFYGRDENLRLRVIDWEFEREIHTYEELNQLGLARNSLRPEDFIAAPTSRN